MIGRSKEVDWTETSVQFLRAVVIEYASWIGIRPPAVRKRNLHPDPTLYAHNQPIPVLSKARFLGVIFDSKLTFLPHILDLRKRCEKALNILKVLSNTSWGADRTFYSECMRQ
ncbi:hypothetical protein AVEN_30674-1 [Araneus ventricosus]|uniref:Uncharacterized protein n=1 Tax=Araneus ventricosus TaxID=182803 RepID=A0A4Y2IW09_ARAVE|nr:hypothetical protein AVEN_30674-1 [Araneus ventricosus]